MVYVVLGLMIMLLFSYRTRNRLERELADTVDKASMQDALNSVSTQYLQNRLDSTLERVSLNIENTYKRYKKVYYIPRINEIVEYSELKEIGDL